MSKARTDNDSWEITESLEQVEDEVPGNLFVAAERTGA